MPPFYLSIFVCLYLETWLKDASQGKKTRLKYLCGLLCLVSEPPLNIRYQLLHRTASAIIEAKRFNAKYAVMIVHSFNTDHKWFSDYQDFLRLFGVAGKVNELVELPQVEGVQLFTGWVVGQSRAG